MQPLQQPLRIALIGCGQIADAHLQEIAKLRCARAVAVCDLHRDLAYQAGARFGIEAIYNDHRRMLQEVRPDIVHVTTPAHTHHRLAVELLQHGCHTYVEKPLALNAGEVGEIIAAANASGRMVCVGHDQLFDPAWLECRHRIDSGEIGAVRHVESVLGYPLSGQFGALASSDPGHWVRRLPGGLFHNTISHPLYRITELLPDAEPQIDARWFARNNADFPSDLRVELQGGAVTGSLLFDTAIEPQRITRVYGTQGCLTVDLDAQTVERRRAPKLPGAFGRLETPWRNWRQSARCLRRNVGRFLRSDLHYFAGMRGLIEAFCNAIQAGGPPPIAYTEMRRVTHLMDRIFAEMQPLGVQPVGVQPSGCRTALDSRPPTAVSTT
ncbi:MAG: Gfo/Idh/MocA family oxidoreductase [Planctomycetaceae bacterium]|nr:Gfo/Idh/MocA family oxidoreductase [Planctomycetaceae bacterium]